MEKKRILDQDKLLNIIDYLKDYRYQNMKDIEYFDACKGDLDKDDIYRTCKKVVKGMTIKCGDFFVGRDNYLWLEKKIKIPARRVGFMPIGLFDFGKTGINNKYGFESLLYVNEKPYQGVDGNHQEVYFDMYANKTVKLTFLLWSGLEGGGLVKRIKHTIHSAKIGLLNENCDELYYLLKGLLDTLNIIDDETIKEKLVDVAINVSDLLSVELIDNKIIDESLNYLKDSLRRIKNNRKETIYLTGHSHIDVTWLWRLKHTREKTQRTFSTVLKLMQENPEFTFIQSQPQLYEFIKNDNPYLYKQIVEKIKEKRWQADGGMWVEADCNIPSGESLVRQFIYGINYIKDNFNKKCEYLWLPDVFGYSYALPQIMKLCDINTFMTTKISWNDTNEMPNDLFYWQGIDGSKILTYFMNTPNDNIRSVRYGKVSNYSAELAPMVAYGSWSRFKNKDLTNDLLISFGYGDGGGGPARYMIKNAKVINQVAGLPKVKFDNPSNLFKKIHKNIEGKKVPVWKDELYLELHRATYTTQALNKKYNRKLEFKLLENEYYSVLCSLSGKKYNNDILDKAWREVLLNQFHDNLPGSSIKEVYDDTTLSYEKVYESLDKLENNNINYLINESKDKYTLYRFADVDIKENVFVKERRNGFFTCDDKLLTSQKIKGGYLVNISLKPFKPTVIKFHNGIENKNKVIKVNLHKHLIDTPFYSIKWNKKGFLNSIVVKENNMEILKGQGNILRAYVNRPKQHDAWDIDIEYLDKYDDVALDSVSLVEEGNIRSVIEFKYHFNKSIIVQDLIVYTNNERIDFKTRANWHEDHRLLRSLFELNLNSSKATYDIQFGHLQRNTKWNNSWDKAKFEVCGHKWMDYSDKAFGVSLLNDCKYGYSAINNTIGISLLNSPKYPNPKADMGKHEFVYSLLPHKHKLGLKTIDESLLLNENTKVINGKAKDLRCLIKKDNDAIKIDAIKKAIDDNGYIIHLHEVLGKNNVANIESDYHIKAYSETNLLEAKRKIIKKDKIELEFKPFEIKVLRIWFD